MSRPDPTGQFEETEPAAGGQTSGEEPKTDPAAAGSSVFLQVRSTGQYVNIDSSGWAVISSSAETKYVLVPYYENHYIVVAGGTYRGYYLSFSDYSYVGAYKLWSNARYWAIEPLDSSPYPGMYPYVKWGTTYLCCNGVKDAIDKLIQIYSA